eukprot:CAMPEP_0117648530 /NCGR_PEP_ID=MMETSP0804-20121206/456_1 /TAXON_ID=1074897 /ORGANISM="Tetraselmis astigmatica, Strain CCMP880" /LENGTH=458 /DNA_ID=CAMNT_0005454143 /DNA_START=79 /DNA_END=1455 /DNA_ORIENTATION=+
MSGLRQRTPADSEKTKAVSSDGDANTTAGTTGTATLIAAKPKRKSYCCTFTLVFLVALCTGGYWFYKTEYSQVRLMRLIRDLGRYKAHSRLHKGATGLIPFLLDGDKKLISEEELRKDEDAAAVFTAEELAQYNGADGGPIYLAIMGRIYDVTRGSAFYAKGRSYHHYVAKDATRSFATGCTKPECLLSSLSGLTDEQRKEAFRWVEFYEYHDKYKFVGVLRVDPVEEALIHAQEFEEAIAGRSVEDLDDLALSFYKTEQWDNAFQYWSTALVKLGEPQLTDSKETIRQRSNILMHMVGAAFKQEDTEQAKEWAKEVVAGLEIALGKMADRHPLMGRAVSDRGVVEFSTRNPDEAVSLFRIAAAIYIKSLEPGQEKLLEEAGGRDSVMTEMSNTRYNLMLALDALERYEEAIEAGNLLLKYFIKVDTNEKVDVILKHTAQHLELIDEALKNATEDLYD